MKPISRREHFLDAIADGKPCGIKPATREEYFLNEMASGAGGGSGGGGALLLVVTSNGDGTYNSNYDFATVSAAIENDTGVFGVYSYDKSCGPIGEIFMSDGSVQMREISNGPVQLTWLEETGIREPV